MNSQVVGMIKQVIGTKIFKKNSLRIALIWIYFKSSGNKSKMKEKIKNRFPKIIKFKSLIE